MNRPEKTLSNAAFPYVQYIGWLKGELADARYFQITYLTCFLSFGIYQLGWDILPANVVAVFSTAIITQLAGAYFTRKPLSSVKSALITSLGLTLLLRSSDWAVMALAAFVAIGSKFIIRFNGKHIFNPANIGIVAAVLLTGDAWISPGQWGNQWVLLFMIGAAGLIVVFKVGRFGLSLPFLLTFAALEYARTVLYLGWPPDFFLHKMLNGSLMLFTFFMISDPVSTPLHPRARMAWAALVAVLAFILSNWYFVHTAPVWALFALSPLTIVLDRFFKGSNFQWKPATIVSNP